MRTSRTGICSKGFTLFEIIVVIFVVSMMLAITLPAFSSLKERKLKTEAGRVASILRYLNDSAISTKETCTVQVNIDQGLLQIRGPEGEKKEKIETLSGMTSQSRGRVSNGNVTLTFGPTGAGEHFTIHLTGTNASMDVAFNALSGRVKVSLHEKT